MQNLLKKTVSMILISFFIAALFSVTVSQAAKDIMVVKGTVTSISDETGKLGVEDDLGKIHTLTLKDTIDLKGLTAGDRVLIECDHDGVIESVTKEERSI